MMIQPILPAVQLYDALSDRGSFYGLFRDNKGKELRSLDNPCWDTAVQSPQEWGSGINGYGGRAWGIHDGRIWAVTQEGAVWFFLNEQWQCVFEESGTQWSDGCWHPNRDAVLLVQEQQENQALVWINKDGQRTVLTDQGDFFAAPCLSPQGDKLLWLTWNHPHMPWEETTLHCGCITEDSLSELDQQTGGSFQQPKWITNDTWGYLHDKNGFWQLWCAKEGSCACVNDEPFDCAHPLWQLGQCTWSIFQNMLIIAQRHDHQWRIRMRKNNQWETLEQPWTRVDAITASEENLWIMGGNAALSHGVYSCREKKVVWQAHPAVTTQKEPQFIVSSRCKTEVFDAFYAPDTLGPWPLIMQIHGGPTGEYDTAYDWRRHYWLQKGFAFFAVHYRGSSGSGREYRNALNGKWGVCDAEDCLTALERAMSQFPIDESCMVIRGSSSGGLTALAVLMNSQNHFTHGSCYYPVTKESALHDVHSFERYYSRNLIGDADFWNIGVIDTPIIIFHGEKDPVVPINSSRLLVQELQGRNSRSCLHQWPNEGHGFRDAAVVQKTLDLEYQFFTARIE